MTLIRQKWNLKYEPLLQPAAVRSAYYYRKLDRRNIIYIELKRKWKYIFVAHIYVNSANVMMLLVWRLMDYGDCSQCAFTAMVPMTWKLRCLGKCTFRVMGEALTANRHISLVFHLHEYLAIALKHVNCRNYCITWKGKWELEFG